MSIDRMAEIEKRLRAALHPINLDVRDDSAKHVGHASAGGGGHFHADIVSEVFADKTLLERHRMVYAALGDLMESEIHAFSMSAKTPDELR